MSRKAIVIISLSALTIALLLLLLWQQQRPETPLSPDGQSPSASSTPALGVPQPSVSETGLIRWPNSTRQTYDIQMTSALLVEDVDEPVLAFQLRGLVTLDAFSEDDGTTTLIMGFTEPVFEVAQVTEEGTAVQARASRLEEELAQSSVLSIDRTGRVQAIQVPKKSSGQLQSTIKSLCAMLQFVSPQHHQNTWETQENDTTGTHVAAYLQQGPGTFLKNKQKYLPMGKAKSGTDPDIAAEVRKSDISLSLNPAGEMTALTVTDHIRVTGTQIFSSTEARTEVRLSLQDSEPFSDRSALSALPSTHVATAIDAPTTAHALNEKMDAAKISGLNLTAALQIAADFSGENREDRQKRDRAFLAMEALFRQQPETIAEGLKHIENGSPQSGMLLSALGYASTEASQNALIDLFQRSDKLGISPGTVLQALSQGESPSSENIALHQSLLSHPQHARQAHYGLGSIVYHYRMAKALQAADQTFDILKEALEQCTTPGACIIVLHAIGNAGHPESVQAVQPFLQHADAKLRGAAIQAVRRVPGTDAEQMITAGLLQDLDSSVRQEALDVLGSRQPATAVALAAIIDRAQRDVDARIRYKCVSLLPRFAQIDAASVYKALKWVAENDSEEKIRTQAAELVR